MLRLQQIREERGLSKADVARAAKIDQAGYGRIERQFRKPYEPEQKRLSDVFDIPADELFEEVEADGSSAG